MEKYQNTLFFQNITVHVEKFIFIKFYWKTLCFGKKKTARTVLDQKCFCQIFIKFYQNKCVSVNILICAWKNSTKTLCFGRKKTARTVLDQKCFCHFFKRSTKTNVFTKTKSVFFICARINSTKTLCFGRKKQQELCLIKSVSVNIFIKFYQNKCVLVNILICAWKYST